MGNSWSNETRPLSRSIRSDRLGDYARCRAHPTHVAQREQREPLRGQPQNSFREEGAGSQELGNRLGEWRGPQASGARGTASLCWGRGGLQFEIRMSWKG